MGDKIPFRILRDTLYTVGNEARVLLTLDGFKWPEIEHATYLQLAEMSNAVRKNNPTHRQVIIVIVAWIRFYDRLLDCLIPDNPIRIMGEYHLAELSKPFEKWLKEGESK